MGISWIFNNFFVYLVMSLEDIIYDAYYAGKREELFQEVGRLKKENPSMQLDDLYSQAYYNVTSSNE